MTTYLITKTLLDNFAYYLQDEYKTQEDCRKEFLNMLSREKFAPNEAMQAGLDFEAKVEEFTKTFKAGIRSPEGVGTPVGYIGSIVAGGVWQARCSRELDINGKNFMLYGRCDVVKADTVYDIKFTTKTGNYDLGKYTDSSQHLIYLHCTGLPKFSYLLSDGKDWWREDYFNNPKIEDEIKSKISDFIAYLEGDKEASDLYYSRWASK